MNAILFTVVIYVKSISFVENWFQGFSVQIIWISASATDNWPLMEHPSVCICFSWNGHYVLTLSHNLVKMVLLKICSSFFFMQIWQRIFSMISCTGMFVRNESTLYEISSSNGGCFLICESLFVTLLDKTWDFELWCPAMNQIYEF